jgi:topoisomerase IV subunit B
MSVRYSEQSIQILEGLEAVKKRPGMYIGSTDTRGLHHLVWEIVDNAMDEVLIGEANQIDVIIHEDNSIQVTDNGRGIPIGQHASGIPTPQVIFTKLHAGGKFGGDSGYKMAGGLHGVGASVVNALSKWLEVTIHQQGKVYTQRFEDGANIIGDASIRQGNKHTGTSVWFKPEPTMFSTTLYSYDTIKDHLKQAAYLIKNVRISLTDKRSGDAETFHFEEGILAFVKAINDGKETFHEPIYLESTSDMIEVECAMQFTKGYTDNLLSFVNNVRTKDGGTHETGFKFGLTKIVNEHARRLGLLKEKEANLDGVDIREGLTVVLSVRIPESLLQFEGQTKGKLGTPEARQAVENVIVDRLRYILEEQADFAHQLISKSLDARRVRDAARKAREDARMEKKRSRSEVLLSGKLSPATSKDPKEIELFLVEGDSAGGSAKQGRNRRHQAILPLRGKVINAERASIGDVLKNEEISTIIHTIGAGLGADFDLSKARYHKIIIMTDADTDGAHIQVLLLTFFFRYMPQLIESGKIYLAQPPLYKVNYASGKKASEYAWNEDQLEKLLAKNKGSIQRFKGLGEMNAEQLWDTTMNPETRTLIQLQIDDFSDAEGRIRVLMGDLVEPRRDWIEANIAFVDEDDFNIGQGNE